MATLVHQFLTAWKFPRWRWARLIAASGPATEGRLEDLGLSLDEKAHARTNGAAEGSNQ
jgi:hypothetical protein